MKRLQPEAVLEFLWRWNPIVIAALPVLAFAFIAYEVAEGEPVRFDSWVMLSLRDPSNLSQPVGPQWLLSVAHDITALGGNAVLALLVFFSTAFLAMTGKVRSGIFLLTTVASGALINSLLKLAFARPRPDLVVPLKHETTMSFPSGHAAASAVCYLTLGLLLAQTQSSRSLRIYFIFAATTLTILIGLSRIYLGVHYPTDVAAGWCFGAAWALICQLLMSQFQRRGEIEQSSPASGS